MLTGRRNSRIVDAGVRRPTARCACGRDGRMVGAKGYMRYRIQASKCLSDVTWLSHNTTYLGTRMFHRSLVQEIHCISAVQAAYLFSFWNVGRLSEKGHLSINLHIREVGGTHSIDGLIRSVSESLASFLIIEVVLQPAGHLY